MDPFRFSTRPHCAHAIFVRHTPHLHYSSAPSLRGQAGIPIRPQFVLTSFVRSDTGASRDAYAKTSTRQPSAAIFSSRFFLIDWCTTGCTNDRMWPEKQTATLQGFKAWLPSRWSRRYGSAAMMPALDSARAASAKRPPSVPIFIVGLDTPDPCPICFLCRQRVGLGKRLGTTLARKAT